MENANNKLRLIIQNNQLVELDANMINMMNLSKHQIGKKSNKNINNIIKIQLKMHLCFL